MTLAEAVTSLAGVPSFRPSVDQWAARAQTVTAGVPFGRPYSSPFSVR
jgi:hypothetical protein